MRALISENDPGCVKTPMSNLRVELPFRIFVDMGVDCTANFFRKKAIEKTILRILCPSAFSHSLDPQRTSHLHG